MDYTSLSTRTKLLIISGSLLVHLLLLLLLFIAITGENPFDASRHLDELATILAQSRHEAEDATVVFYDEPAAQANSSMGSEPISSQTDVPFDAYAKTEPKEVAVQETVTESTNVALEETVSETTKLTATHEDREAVRGEPVEPYRTHLPDRILRQAQDERVTKSSEKYASEVIDHQKSEPPAPQKIKKPGAVGASGIGNITLAEITKGFLKSMAQESGGKPTSLNAEQLARQRYGTRVWSLLRQSYNAYKSPTQLLNDIHTHALFVLTIDKTGKIISAELQHPKKSLDIIQIERSLLQAVYKAGLFPPIPKQFDVDTITLSYPLGIRGHEGTHMYDLIYE